MVNNRKVSLLQSLTIKFTSLYIEIKFTKTSQYSKSTQRLHQNILLIVASLCAVFAFSVNNFYQVLVLVTRTCLMQL